MRADDLFNRASPGSCTTAPMCSSMPGCRCWRWTWTRRSPAWSAGIRSGPRPRPRRIPDLYRRLSPFDPSRASASATCTKTWRAMPSSTASCSTMTRCWATSRTPARRRWPRTRRPACPAASPRCAPIPRRCSAGPATRAATWSISPPNWPSARPLRGPRIKTARNLYAEPLLNPPAKPGSRKTRTTSWTPTTGPRPWPCLTWKSAGGPGTGLAGPHRRRGGQAPAGRWTGPCSSCRPSTGAPAGRPSARRHRDAGRLDAAPAAARRAQLRLLPRRFLARPAPAARHPARHLRSVVPHPMIDRLLALLILCAVLSAPFGFALALTSQALLGFVFFYPLFMSGLWMAGGLLLLVALGSATGPGARAAKRRPWPAIRWFPSWCPATTRPTTAKTRCWPR